MRYRCSFGFALRLLAAVALALCAGRGIAQEVTVLCNYEVDWCEAMKAAYEA